MKKLIDTRKKVFWLPTDADTTVETYLSDKLPPLELSTSVYALILKDGCMLQTDLREGERRTRMLDIPGGHINAGETPEEALIRETFEETGIKIKASKLVAYKKITNHSPMPKNFIYPYPISYMLYYTGEIESELPFDGNSEVHGRVWLNPDEYEKSEWYRSDKKMVDEIIANSK